MAILKEISAKSGTYTNKQGEEKTLYVRCGVLLETRNGEAIKLEALPVNFDGWLYLRDPQPREEKPAPPAAKQGSIADMQDDVPF